MRELIGRIVRRCGKIDGATVHLFQNYRFRPVINEPHCSGNGVHIRDDCIRQLDTDILENIDHYK
jgi:hypothetical protein